MSGTVTLKAFRRSAVTLADAMAPVAEILEGAVCIAYSPSACDFAKLGGGKLQSSDGNAFDEGRQGAIFELRAFNDAVELRWLNEVGGVGDAVVLGEDMEPPGGYETVPDLEAVETIDGHYLLWGVSTGQGPSAGWTRLAEARIGSIDVPRGGIGAEQRATLRYREYVAVGEDGANCGVAEERLLGMGVFE